MAWKLTLDEINEYKASFTLIDKDCDGKISSDDLGMLMRSLGRNFSNKELKKITQKIDAKGGLVELHEFLTLMAENVMQEDQSKLVKAFKYFDKDNTGTIELTELKHVLTCVSETLSLEEVEALERLIQLDPNGKFNYRELLQVLLIK
jgi:calmodulin